MNIRSIFIVYVFMNVMLFLYIILFNNWNKIHRMFIFGWAIPTVTYKQKYNMQL